MKKSLLLIMAVFVGFAVMAQRYTVKPNLKTEKAITAARVAAEPAKAYNLGQNQNAVAPQKAFKNTDFVNILSIGSSANAYGNGYAGGQKALVWVNDEINTVTYFHRMGGTLDPGGYSGDLGYDISTDGGMTFTNMNEVYVAVNNAGGTYYTDAARYPNHGIYNPAGNTDPNNAYVTYWAPTLDGSNGAGSWGGYGFGRAKIGTPTDTIRQLKSSRPGDGVFQYIPDAYCVTNTGEVWVGDLNQDWTSGALVYQNSMIINHGVWDDVEMEFVYEETILDCSTIDGSRPSNHKIEFAPDGMTGYIVTLGDNGEVPISAGLSYFPLIYKTTDGGQTWSDQMAVPLAGPDGVGAVHNFLSDAEIAELFEAPLPGRDEIPFTTAFDLDLTVDAWGNPHIAVLVGVTGSDAYSIVSGVSTVSGNLFCAAMDITSLDGGNTWVGYNCGRTYSFRGTFGDLTEDNRICITRSPDATKMFVSWIDTYLPGVTDNNQPDIWCRGIDLVSNKLTVVNGEDKANNVTEFSEGMWQAYFATAPNASFENNGTYTIPFVYNQMTPEDPAQPVLFKYVQDFKYTDADFLLTGVEENSSIAKAAINVSQNFPNPANGKTSVAVTLKDASSVSFEVVNMMGQKVYEIAASNYGSGIHTFSFDASVLADGVYFYTVTAGEEKITKKMIVK